MSVIEEKKALRTFIRKKERTLDPAYKAESSEAICRHLLALDEYKNAKIVCEAERLRPEKSEVNRLLGDATKLRTLTDWKPQYTFEQGLAETIEFLRGNLDQYKVGQYIL